MRSITSRLSESRISSIELLGSLLLAPDIGVVFCDLGCMPGLVGLPRCANSRFLLGRSTGVVDGPKGVGFRSRLTAMGLAVSISKRPSFCSLSRQRTTLGACWCWGGARRACCRTLYSRLANRDYVVARNTCYLQAFGAYPRAAESPAWRRCAPSWSLHPVRWQASPEWPAGSQSPLSTYPFPVTSGWPCCSAPHVVHGNERRTRRIIVGRSDAQCTPEKRGCDARNPGGAGFEGSRMKKRPKLRDAGFRGSVRDVGDA